MNNLKEKKLLERFKISAGLYNFKDTASNNTLTEYHKERNTLLEKYRRKQIAFSILFILVFGVSGIALATNYEKIINSFMMGNGIDKATDNGYIQPVDMDYENSNVIVTNDEGECLSKDSNIGIKIEDFLIDDTNLSTHFNIKLDEKTQNIMNLNKITQLEINNINIIDEKNNKVNEVGCGINYFIAGKDEENNTLSFTYNLYTNKTFPNSSELNYEIKNLTLKDNEKSIYLEGNWKFSLPVPEEMIQRTSIDYEVINCDNKDFNVYTAKATNTGFEIGITINNVKTLTNPLEDFKKDLDKRYDNGEIDINEYNKLYSEKENEPGVFEQYSEYLLSTTPIKVNTDNENIENTSYVENSNGERFLCTMSPSRRSNQNFIDNSTLDFYETFGLTKNEATEYLTVQLMYNENPVIIQLKKK